MANEFENMQTAPVLTLEPFKEEETAVQVVEEKEVVVEEPILTPEEQAAEMGFKDLLDATNNGYVVQYYNNPITHTNEFKLVRDQVKDLEDAHMAWEAERDTIIAKLEMLIGDTPYKVYKDTLRETIEFIKRGEV